MNTATMDHKPLLLRLKKLFASKLMVILAIVGLWGVGINTINNSVNADSYYRFGTVYQYFMLYNKSSDVTDDAKKQKVASLGNFGSGGVSGTFSYNDIVNGVSGNKKEVAKQFSSMMATYSTFGYISNFVQGFETIPRLFVRGVSILLLLPLGFVTDIIGAILPGIINLLAKFNVVVLLGSFFSNLGAVSALAEAIGITKETMTKFLNTLISFNVAAILIAVLMMFRRGSSNIDRRGAHKVSGRLMTWIGLPLVVFAGAYVINSITDMAKDETTLSEGYARYMIDVRNWAYQFNFAPDGNNSNASGGISMGKNGSFVDLSFDPYTKKGGERIKNINSLSPLAGNAAVLKNSTLAMAYGGSEYFSASDYIAYVGSKAAADSQAAGSYYFIATTYGDQLADTKHAYEGNLALKMDKYTADGPFTSAKDDYIKKDKLIVSPQVAWRDRFIYGSKTGGAKMDDYYGEAPSWEQVNNTVGTGESANGKNYGLSDQSMFLALSTIFNENGGRYYIDAPARGVMQAKSAFDSNRSQYYTVSMVGNPYFTIPAMMAEPIIEVVALITVIIAVFSIGLVEMNTKPFSAFLKGATLGDIEYPEAFLVYTVGIAGTVLMLVAVPKFLIATLKAIGKVLLIPAAKAANTPQSSMVAQGTPLLVSCLVALITAIMFWKSPRFRNGLIDLYTLPWAWAKSSGERLERQANPGGWQTRSAQREMRNNKLTGLIDKTAAGNNAAIRKRLSAFANSVRKNDPDGNNPDGNNPQVPTAPTDGGTTPNNGSSLDQLKRKANVGHAREAVQQLNADDSKLGGLKDKAEQDLQQFLDHPTKHNLYNAEHSLEELRENVDPEDREKVDRAIDRLHGNDNDSKPETKDPTTTSDGANGDQKTSQTPVKGSGEGSQAEKASDIKSDGGETPSSADSGATGPNDPDIVKSGDGSQAEKASDIKGDGADVPSSVQAENGSAADKGSDNPVAGSHDPSTVKTDGQPTSASSVVASLDGKVVPDMPTQVAQPADGTRATDSGVASAAKQVVERKIKSDGGSNGNNEAQHTKIVNVDKHDQNVNNDNRQTTHTDQSRTSHGSHTSSQSETRNTVDRSSSVENHLSTSEIKKLYHQSTQRLETSLGRSMTNPEVRAAYQRIVNSKTNDSLKENIGLLNKSFTKLDKNTLSSINQSRTINSLQDMVKLRNK